MELCRRLNELNRQGHINRGVSGSHLKKRKPALPSGPYRHVPLNAAKDFTRTTNSNRGQEKTASQRLRSLPGPNKTVRNYKDREAYRMSKEASQVSPLMSQQNGKSLDQACARRSRISGQDGLDTEPSRDRARTRSENFYDTLLSDFDGMHRLNDGDNETRQSVELELQSGLHALAHKITRQHLEDRADW